MATGGSAYENNQMAVVGPGFIAGRFAQGMLEAPGAERTAVVSRSEENGRAYAEKYGFASSYTDFEKMLRESKPDVVIYRHARTTPIWIMCPRP